MGGVTPGITRLIGNTPMVPLAANDSDSSALILGKLEMFNPGGSVKDRIALHMVEQAEKAGVLKPGGTIIEATSGNTGIGLALVAAAKGYKLIIVMPETMSKERRDLMTGYGVELILTPGEQEMRGSVNRAEQIARENPSYFMARQFENPANPEAHELTTAREILQQTDGQLDAFVAGIGTGGTITGVGRVLKKEIPGVRIIGVEPKSSAILSGGQPGPHLIQGIGAGFLPQTLDLVLVDKIITVSDTDAYLTSVNLSKKEGIMAGVSSGAAVFAAYQVAKELGPGKRVVTLLPDRGERYLSMEPYFRLELRKRGIKLYKEAGL